MLVSVTGGTGLLGGYICTALIAKGLGVRAMARPSSDTSLLEELGCEIFHGDMCDPSCFEPFVASADCVVHAALADWEDEMDNFRRNLLGSLQLLELSRRAGAQFVFISSGAVHVKILDDRPLDEKHPLWAGNTYGGYKAAVEAFIPPYAASYGVNASAFRPTVIYGLHLTRPEKSHWYSLVADVLSGRAVEASNGAKVIHAADVAEVVSLAVGREDIAGESFELTDCHVYDQAVAEFAREIAGVDTKIADMAGSGPQHMIVCDKARSTFGVGLDRGHAGVREYVEDLVGLFSRP